MKKHAWADRICSKGTAIPTQHISTAHAKRERQVPIDLLRSEIGNFLEQVQ